jgi:predicted nuclease of restriction endonuclease-like (RecB) superfamily
MTELSPLPADYTALLGEIRQRVRQAQTRAVLAVNAELIRLYWEIGGLIHRRQQQEGWGAGVIPRLARDLHKELPRAYPHLAEGPQPVAQTQTSPEGPQPVALFPPELLLAVPWGHHAELMAKVKEPASRHWYMQAAVQHGWSRSVLLMQIESAAHLRVGRSTSNFAQRLPAPESDLVQQTLKDPYIFDFLTLADGYQERELETALVRHLEKFLLELGQGFAFVGRQYHLDLGGQDFYIDLLFYHLKLRCFVVIDLKRGSFKPEYAGKMNFYCNVVDDHLRHPGDAPTIGLILCQQSNRILAE